MGVKGKKVVCRICGTVLELDDPAENRDVDWLPCVLPEGFEWTLPAGRIESATGQIWYVDSNGRQWTHQGYIEKYGVDPEIAYQNMRKKSGVRIR